MTDYCALDRRALEVAVPVVRLVDNDSLDLPTPCADWNLGELLSHMVGQNYGFAAAAGGEMDDLSVWQPRKLGPDPAADFAASADAVLEAFANDLTQPGSWWLPEIRSGALIPAQAAMSFHFIDTVVHSWDVAVSIGVPVTFDDDLLASALKVAQRVPGGSARETEGAAFGAALAAPADASSQEGSTLGQILTQLGRSPAWPK